MELGAARLNLAKNEASGIAKKESTKQAVELLTTVVDDLVRGTTWERLGSVQKDLQRLRVYQNVIQKTYDKVLKKFGGQSREPPRWRTRRHQGVHAKPWRDHSKYYDQWCYGPEIYDVQRKERQCD